MECRRKIMDPVHYFDATRKSDPDYWDPLDGATDSGWYFWVETWADRIGPFETEDIARWEGLRYAMILNGLGEFFGQEAADGVAVGQSQNQGRLRRSEWVVRKVP